LNGFQVGILNINHYPGAPLLLKKTKIIQLSEDQ
jgi:hypothetical protein